MATVEQLVTQMRADPRLKAMATGKGGIRAVKGPQLRALGYDVPDNYTFTVGGRSGAGSLSDGTRDFMERWAPRIAVGMGAVAGAGAAGAIPGIGGAGGGGSLASAGAVGSAPAYVPESMVGMGLGGAGTGAVSAADFLGAKPSAVGNIAKTVAGAASEANPWVKAALAALSGVPALIAANKNEPSAEERTMQDQLRQMLAGQQKRVDYQNPLFQAVTQLAMSRQPTAHQRPLAENL